MDARSILFGLHELPGFGWRSIQKLLHRVPDLTNLLQRGWNQQELSGLQPDKLKALKDNFHMDFVASRLNKYAEAGIRFVTVLDEAYPALLKQTAKPPWVLYYRGNDRLLQASAIAVVGTRTPTTYGKKAAERLSRELSDAGLTVVSGLARGIDSSAHLGALQGKGSTIAVLGTGPDIVYPPENKSLYREIAEKGLILSEFPLGTSPHPGLFPLRNRIIAGISLGTVVVEAALKSGSLITADQALEESREVFAVPGPITSPKSLGALSLIKQGAKLVTGAEDILEEYGVLPAANSAAATGYRNTSMRTEEERLILGLMREEPISFDDLLERSHFQFGHLHSVLLSLLMKKEIEQLPGSMYVIL
ncbi:DNA-processing protein DprA [Ferviditalea candida]|uniref:DNA-processing protein DprA n=1 Tax=Ferviditalea candida TaxID=3108399 RepID=A0ABU5ZH44_9BACL|nr:DNA-processing protein DprA [Paenibacillaceae bacterium T2]